MGAEQSTPEGAPAANEPAAISEALPIPTGGDVDKAYPVKGNGINATSAGDDFSNGSNVTTISNLSSDMSITDDGLAAELVVPAPFDKGYFSKRGSRKAIGSPATGDGESDSSGTKSNRSWLAALSWRPQSFRLTPRSAAAGRGHIDPKKVYEGITGFSLRTAINQPSQLKELLRVATAEGTLESKISAKDSDGDRTPLHWAAARGYLRIINLLVQAGADKTAVDANGNTPAELASLCDRHEAYELLLYGPALDDFKPMTGREGSASLHCALLQPQQLASILAAAPPPRSEGRSDPEFFSPNRRDDDGDRYPVHWAAARGSTACLQLLLDAGANIGVTDAQGNTAAGLALQLNQRATHAMLTKAIDDAQTDRHLVA